MATVMSRPGRESRSSRVHPKRRVHSPKSVLLPESLDTSSESSSLASSTLGEQIVECMSFRNPSKAKEPSNGRSKPAVAEASFEQVDSYAWFVSIDRPSDLLVEVDGISFHLHKLPILSRSGLLFRLASRSCESRRAYVKLVDFPGGAEAFILVAKFCYGIVEELTPTNVASIRCAAERLEMTEAFEEGNVVSKAEAYLDLVILNSWRESIIVLQSCELLLPWAEDMELVRRCAQSVAVKACSDPRGVRWLFSGSSSTAARDLLEGSNPGVAPEGWWHEDVSHLTIYCFGEVMEAIRESGAMDTELVGGALEYYAQRWLPGLVKPAPGSTGSAAPTGKNSPTSSPRKDIVVFDNGACKRGALRLEDAGGGATRVHEAIAEQNRNRFILEEIVSMMPPQRDAVSCSFLLRMTRAAHMLNCDGDCKAELERRAGVVLDQASLSDLLIPCFSHTSEYLYDIDLVRRILGHFLSQEQGAASGPTSCTGDWVAAGGVHDGPSPVTTPPPALTSRAKVAKLVDSYLAEVARDSKLPLSKFQPLAEALPVGSRLCDDGLYRAVDTYLKIHPALAEHERKRLCRILHCHRLSLDACTHASQNERLPLRFVVQVLFCEQLKIRSTITEVSNSAKEERGNPDDASVTSREVTGDSYGQQQPTASSSSAGANGNPGVQESVNQMEIRALQRELATMRVKCNDLERDQGNIQDQVHEISRASRARSSSWSSGAWKKISKLHLFSGSQSKDSSPGESGRTDESRGSNPRRWRNSIS